MQLRRTSLFVIFLTVFIDLVGFGMVLPLLPMFSREFGAQGFEIGLVNSVYSAMQFIFAPLWGRLSDRVGRRPILLFSNAGSAVSYLALAHALTVGGEAGWWLLIASRVFAGICGANISVASAYIADISPPEKRSRGMGLIGMAFGLGFIFGPAIGGLSAEFLGNAGPGLVGACICGVNVVLTFLILGESRVPGKEARQSRPRVQQWRQTLRHPVIGVVILVFFLATLCFAAFETAAGLFYEERWGFSKKEVGLLITYCGVIAAIVQGGLIGRLVRRHGERRLIFISLLFSGASLALLPFVSGFALMLGVLALFAAFSGMARPPIFGLISINASAEEQGATLGVAQSAGSLARIFGPLLATTLLDWHLALPWVVCGGIAVVAAALFWGLLLREGAGHTAGVTGTEGRQGEAAPG